jgi:hypothetical protein
MTGRNRRLKVGVAPGRWRGDFIFEFVHLQPSVTSRGTFGRKDQGRRSGLFGQKEFEARGTRSVVDRGETKREGS